MSDPYEPRDPNTQLYLRAKWLQDWSPLVTITVSVIAVLIILAQAIIYDQQRRAMKDTLKEMRTSRELENRAWVGVKTVDYVANESGGIDIVAVYVNTGNTPTIATIEYHGEMRPDSPPDDMEYPRLESPPSRIALFPNLERPSRLVRLDGVPIDRTNPNHFFYVYGVIKYDDVFGKHHTTKFCYSDRRKTPGLATLGVCSTHNSFD